MCGIAGIIGPGEKPSRLNAMIDAQRHRGPDGTGTYVDSQGRAGLGHTRLSIIDLSAAGLQPMKSNTGRQYIVLNGEIYNYRELRSELSDYPFQSQTDTEVLLAAYLRWGKDCLTKLNGMFGFAIWDEDTGTLFCARDRLGIKPFYFARHGEDLLFASEIKAILAAGFPARVNERALWDYLSLGYCDHTIETFFDGVLSLPAGHFMTVRDNTVSTGSYWSLAEIIEAQGTPTEPPADWRAELTDLLEDSVRLRLRSDVPVGLHLSGGLDSSVLLSVLDGVLPAGGDLHAFTAIYGDATYDETVFAREVAQNLNVRHHTASFDADQFWQTAEKTQWHQEQPFGGLSTLCYWFLESTVRDHDITVILEGQGGDELFGGYAYFLADHAHDLAADATGQSLGRFIEQYAQATNVEVSAARDQITRMQQGRGQTYQDGTRFLRTDCLSTDFARTAGTGATFPTPSSSAFTNARYRDLCFTKLPRVLRINDRMSMAFGRELRVPILDHRIVELAFRLPNSLLLQDGLSKFPLRQVNADSIPDSIRLAPKRAVVNPQREWFRGQLRKEIEERLADSTLAAAGYMDRKKTQAAFAEFCANPNISNSFFVWQWLNLDLWWRAFDPS